MITVAILINGNPLLARSAHRIKGNEGEVCIYHCDNGEKIEHNYNDGAVVLAHKLLDTIKEMPISQRKLEILDKLFKDTGGKNDFI